MDRVCCARGCLQAEDRCLVLSLCPPQPPSLSLSVSLSVSQQDTRHTVGAAAYPYSILHRLAQKRRDRGRPPPISPPTLTTLPLVFPPPPRCPSFSLSLSSACRPWRRQCSRRQSSFFLPCCATRRPRALGLWLGTDRCERVCSAPDATRGGWEGGCCRAGEERGEGGSRGGVVSSFW